MPQLVRLQADYFIEPIFLGAEDFDDTDYVNASDLPLSPGLTEAIDAWQQALDITFDHQFGRNSGFKTDEERVAFHTRGLDLARRLQSELGSEYEVYYEREPVFAQASS
ncbi:MAG: hypothetical protein NW237_16895 [Cyanobacteriota bacterium]|nr:hypothetical protein [Cyanobacteriota bacterium]